MSEYYDHYHRWEPLAEFHFNKDSEDEEEYDGDNYLYCLCSRAFIRDTVKLYSTEKEYASESDVEALQDSQSQEWEDHSHVHFSLDTSYKVKCEKDDVASCYCSASHTDNCCSTDEHDAAQIHGMSHALQPSDSGADLTYQDYHSDYTTHDKLDKMDQDFTGIENEDYLSEDTWDKFWAIHGERLIWASWIKKYSDYINPAYLNENNDLIMDDSGIPKQHSVDEIYKETLSPKDDEDSMRERKFSYDSKVNPYKKINIHNNAEKIEKVIAPNKDEQWLPIARRRSCSEHDRILSPRTVAGTDSMTNVTKLTLSSYDITSSHVTSESTPTDDYSVSSSSDDQSNDQTRIANVDEPFDPDPVEEMDTEQYWQFLWKKHFGEQYALHYANYIQQHSHNKETLAISVEKIELKDKPEEKVIEIECENSEGNSQEMPTIIEVQTQVEQIQLDSKPAKSKKRNKKPSTKYLGSVGVLLQNLLKEEQKKCDDIAELTEVAETEDTNKSESPVANTEVDSAEASNKPQSVSNNNFTSYSYDDGDDDPPEDTPIALKRSHEIEDEMIASEKIRSTFETMGYSLHPDKMPKGFLVYRKRIGRLRPPRYKKFGNGKKTYFDDDGNAYQNDQTRSPQYDRDMQTDDEGALAKSDTEKTSDTISTNTQAQTKQTELSTKELALEAANTPLPADVETLSDTQEYSDRQKSDECDSTVTQQETTKRRRRQKRYAKLEEEEHDTTELPPELRDDKKMLKYWKKRHSLFHRFDEGIRLDHESWFSVTPESVARHIATKCGRDVLLDAFCGAGGNAIQFAHTCKKVIAVDIDPVKIEMARHNAGVYGVADRIEFIVGDFFELAPKLKADMVFLSPPWGGPNYTKNREYDIETMLEPRPASELMDVARTISTSIALYLPRNSRPDQILALAKDVGGSVEVEQSYLDKRFVAITAYFY